jgi:uncharacterized protein (TIGR02246 family)
VQEIIDAWANGDAAAIEELYHKDWTATMIGRENISEFNLPSLRAGAFTQTKLIMDYYDVVEIAPGLAVAKGKFAYPSPDGPEWVYATHIYKKEDGRWLMFQNHESYLP